MEYRVNGEHNSPTTHSPILWQNANRTVTLLDIPHSISKAQGSHDAPSFRHLVSSSPPLAPFPSNEPKSASARAKLGQNTVDAELHAEYKRLLEEAIEDAKKNHDGLWCLPRPFIEEAPRAVKKRRLGNEANATSTTARLETTHPDNGLTGEFLLDVARGSSDESHAYITGRMHDSSGKPVETISQEESETNLFSNDLNHATSFQLISTTNTDSITFHIPPKASFWIGDCADARSFHASIRNQAQRTSTRKQFDFILLDPPWPNRSVKRTHKTPGSTYSTSPSLWDIRGLLLDTDLDMLMADECLVGMWITNKPNMRERVLDEEGIFACWGVELVEEWLWLKTTASGEPVTPLDGIWRKPYEVLLLGRKHGKGTGAQESDRPSREAGRDVKRRVIIGVPDLHSRKPCLKEFIEPLMPNRNDYRALEVFARHLVARWWSWGDECIKFNWEGFWRGRDDTSGDSIPSERVKT